MSEEQSNQPYRVLARKYRPQVFDDLIGQEPMVRTLSNAFRLNRIAQAYMLTGVRGVGKTTTARILARALNYESDEVTAPLIDFKEEGIHCRSIIEGRHMDVIEMDAASHTGIDDIRDLIESAQYKPTQARYKVYIIDEVHMLSKSAFNGLLKTLEEPPEHLKFIFATTEIRKVPVTVLSRCQRFDLRRIKSGELSAHLDKICGNEKVEADKDALAMISRAADGSVRDALSILDQAIAHGTGDEGSGQNAVSVEIVREMLGLTDRARIVDLFEHVMKGDISSALAELNSQYETGAEPSVVLSDLADFIHLVTRLKYVEDTQNDHSLSEIEKTKGKEFADALSVRILGRAWQVILKGLAEVNAAERPLPVAEMALVRLTHASSLPTPDDLLKNPVSFDEHVKPSGETQTQAPTDGATSAMNVAAPAVQTQAENPSAPMQTTSSITSGQVIAMREPQRTPAPQRAEVFDDQKPQTRTLHTFDELIFLIEDKRDLAMKTAIKRHVRLVSFADGRMEMNLVENAPRDFTAKLTKKLEQWTGKRWVLSISQEDGAPTLAEIEELENANKMQDAKDDPVVDSILKQFPGSKIVDIRIKQEVAEEFISADEDEDDDA